MNMNTIELRTQNATLGRNQSQDKTIDYHIKLAAIINNLHYEYADYKYTVYRCASKIVTLQKRFYTSNIPYRLVLAVVERHIEQKANNALMVTPFQLTSLIHDIYFACEKLGHFTNLPNYKLEAATVILANFFWNIFDPNRRHSVSLLEIKVIFLVLCKLYASEELVGEFYNLVHDTKSKCVPKLNFVNLLNVFIKFLSYIGEGQGYGVHNLQLIVQQTFSKHNTKSGLTEAEFYSVWSTTRTRFLIYANLLALVKRIEVFDKMVHNNSCAACHVDKIVGLRFKCQACKDLSLCLKCFATGFSTNKHESKHRMYEIFTADPTPRRFSYFLAKICTSFCPTNVAQNNMDDSCDFNENGNTDVTELVASSGASCVVEENATSRAKESMEVAMGSVKLHTNHIPTTMTTDNITPALTNLSNTALNASNASGRLQSIIDRLIKHNAKIEHELKYVKSATHEEIAEILRGHQKFLIEIINEMRNFSQASFISYPVSSTPNRSSEFMQPTTHPFNTNGSNLTHSLNGNDVNHSYMDAYKSDYSTNDLSVHFNQRRSTTTQRVAPKEHCSQTHEGESITDVDVHKTEMLNFKLLLNKVKEILEFSYSSENSELAEATQNLENVLEHIINCEEKL